MTRGTLRAAIVDYGLGNLYSVKHACEHVGLRADVTAEAGAIAGADLVVLPGVGAFGDAMRTLMRLDLVSVLQDVTARGTPFLGICLGLQLLFDGSEEFGSQAGLGIVPGRVVKIAGAHEGTRVLKVPQIGWNGIHRHGAGDPWAGTLLEGTAEDAPMYFVHSYMAEPADPSATIATATYGGVRLCAAVRRGNVVACQFHPERSGPDGLRMYATLARQLGEAR